MDFSKIKLVSSNENKLKEFKRFGLNIDIQKGLDLEEVDSNPMDVVIYKAIDAGKNMLVEDTILIVDGEEVVDIRAKIDDLQDFLYKEAVWKVSLAVVIDEQIYVATGEVKGVIDNPVTDPRQAFGFDPYFYPIENNEGRFSLHQMEMKGFKDDFSARKNAIEALIEEKGSFSKIDLKNIKPWEGDYQKIDH